MPSLTKRTIAILIGLGAILLVWAVVFLPGSDPQPKPEEKPLETPEPVPEAAMPNTEPTLGAPSAAPTPPAPPSEQHAPAELRPSEQPRAEKIGPVEELKAAYESDGRDPEAGATEERIRKHLKEMEVPAEMLRRVSCVKSVCKLEVRWAARDSQAYMVAMMTLIKHVSQKLAADPAGEDEGNGVYPVDLYVSRDATANPN